MKETTKTDYEAIQDQMTKNIRATEAIRADKDKQGYAGTTTNIKENFKMEYNITGKITSKVLNYISSVAVDYNVMPVDMKFHLNNLSETEFKLYAHNLMDYAYAHPFDVVEYPTKQDRDTRFYNFRDCNKHLIDDSTNIPVSAYTPAKEYHIPTDTEIRLKNDLEWTNLKVEYLADRLNNSADAYLFMKAILEDTEQKLTDTKEAWIQDLAWQHETGYISVDDAIADLAKDKAITALLKKYDYSPRTRK